MGPPCVLFEDDHLLVVNKPAGLNTHAPNPYAGEGLYDWLRHREPRWAKLAIIHRLDKETSGVMVFAKTPLANRSLTQQFTERAVRKKYLLLTDRVVPTRELIVRSQLARVGDKYVSQPGGRATQPAETRFTPVAADDLGSTLADVGNCHALSAEPLTGRTHQIRVHAADKGFPILGDTLYGGTLSARVFLHAAELTLKHPATGETVTFRAPPDFGADPRQVLRRALIDLSTTNAFRLVHGASDAWPGLYVDRLGEFVLSHAETDLDTQQREKIADLVKGVGARAAYHKILSRHVRQASAAEASPHLEIGVAAPERFRILENQLQFELSFNEGYSAGLFLDQRDNRRRLLSGHIAAGYELHPNGAGSEPRHSLEVLNTFAYTCAFSVAAAKGGAHTTSLDLSKKYLEWGKRNFVINDLDPDRHQFIFGDVFDWARRLAKKGKTYDVILLDPPTFSQAKSSGVFRADKDYGRLVTAVLPLLKTDGVLFASTNAARWAPPDFIAQVTSAIAAARRNILQQHYVPQPPDFPISRAEPGHLKTVWLRVA